MKIKPILFVSPVVLVLALTVVVCALAVAPATQDKEKEDPSKGSKDVDQTVAYPMAKVLDAARLAMATYGCDSKKDKEKADYLECTRDRHVGVMVGSGGEKVTVKLSEKGSETRVEIKTGKGFVGRLGKKNWSTPIFDEMMKTLKGS
jgi:hypothetical protein